MLDDDRDNAQLAKAYFSKIYSVTNQADPLTGLQALDPKQTDLQFYPTTLNDLLEQYSNLLYGFNLAGQIKTVDASEKCKPSEQADGKREIRPIIFIVLFLLLVSSK